MRPSTAAWVARARGGDRSAWSSLHAHYAPVVHAVALSRLAPQHADDIVQETFTRALERLAELRDDEAFGPWLLAIARNLAASHHRTARRFFALPDILPWHPRPTAEAAEALAAIRALPEAYAELLAMRLIEGLSGPEIATRTGRPEGSVRVSLHRGMKLLRERLGADG